MDRMFFKLVGHRPIPCKDHWDWARWYEIGDRRVAEDYPAEDCRVSTVFLGLDHNHTGKGPPILFETMVFGGPMDDYMRRYATWEEAEKGHAEIRHQCCVAIQKAVAEADIALTRITKKTPGNP